MLDCGGDEACGHAWHPLFCPNCEHEFADPSTARCETCGDNLTARRRGRVLDDECPWCGAGGVGRRLCDLVETMDDGEEPPDLPTDRELHLAASERLGGELRPMPYASSDRRSVLSLVYLAWTSLGRDAGGRVTWQERRAFFEGVGLGWVDEAGRDERAWWDGLFAVVTGVAIEEEARRFGKKSDS